MAYWLPHPGAAMWCMGDPRPILGPDVDVTEHLETRAVRTTYRDEALAWLTVVRRGSGRAAEHPEAVRALRRRERAATAG